MNTLPTLNRGNRSLASAATSGLGMARHPMVSRAGNRFTLVDGAGNTRPMTLMDQQGRVYMDVVIFDASPHPNRMFFDGIYDPDAGTPPTCFSDNGQGPSSQARDPQAPTCAACPQAVWGSRVTPQGKEVPACQIGKKLAVLVVGDESGQAFEFRVPPGSFGGNPTTDPQEGGWTWYVKSLKGYNMELFDVVTRITFVPNTMGQLVFKPIAQLDAGLVGRVNDAWARNVSEDLVGLKDVPADLARIGQRAVAPQVTQGQTPAQVAPPPPRRAVSPHPAAALYSPAPQQVQPQFPPHQLGAQPASQQFAPQAAPQPQALYAPPPPPMQAPQPMVPQEAPKRGRGRPAKGQQEQAMQPAPVDADVIPPFLQRAPQPAAPVAIPQAPGIVPNPPAPSAELQQKLDQAFQLPPHG